MLLFNATRGDELTVETVLVEAGACLSFGESRRLVANGGVKLGQKVMASGERLTLVRDMTLSVGSKQEIKIVVR